MSYNFFNNEEKYWVRMDNAVLPQCVEIQFFVQSPVSRNLHGQCLNEFHISLARKNASFGQPANCRNLYGRLSQLREKYGTSA